MPATRSQRANLASGLPSPRRPRSVSRAVSVEAPPSVAGAVASADTKTKRKAAEVEVEAVERPAKKQATLKDRVFQDTVKSRLAEKRRLEAQQQEQQKQQQQQQTPVVDLTKRYVRYPRMQQEQPAAEPTPSPGFLGRFFQSITPFKWRPKTPQHDTRLADARIDLLQLQEHTKLQLQLNKTIARQLREEEAQNPVEALHDDKDPAPAPANPGQKRKFTTLETHRLPQINPPLNDITESPESRYRDTMQTPSKPTQITNTGPTPRTMPKQRRTYKEARAAAANRSMRNANDPPTPMIAKSAPSTPYDKNDYARIRRLRDIELLRLHQEETDRKLAKLRAEQEAEAELQPRKTKRVKLDHLKEIPHNLPGESSGSFRFPEEDSDDEMEVYDDVSTIDTPFESDADDNNNDDEPTPRQASPTKTPAVSFAAPTPAPNFTPSSAPTFAQPTAKAPSPSKPSLFAAPKAPSPTKKAPSPVEKVIDVVELEDDAEENRDTATPEPPQLVADDAEDETDIDDIENWPELPAKKQNEPEPSQAWKLEALTTFDKEYEQWEVTGEIITD